MDKFVEDVSRFACDFSLEWVDEEVIGVAAARLADSVACGIGGWDSVLDTAARAVAFSTKPGPSSGLLLGEDVHVAADMAAFINTVALRYLDFNDAYPGGHPSDMIGGLLAVAGSMGSTGRELLAAIIVAYEVNTRVSTSVHLLSRAIDQGFGVGLGTVAGAGRLLNLSSDQIANALGMMAVAGVPLRASRGGELSNWKGAATAVFVRNAVFFCLLAREGLTGPPHPILGRHGLAELLDREIDIPDMPVAGGDFRISGTRLKFWPVAYNMQPAIWAAKRLHGKIEPSRVSGVRLYTDKFAKHESGSEPEKWDPRTRETADHSLPYVIAWTLLYGSLDSSSFDDDAIAQVDVRDLMKLIEVEMDPQIESEWPALIQARLEITDVDDQTVVEHVVNPPGHDQNPLSSSDVKEKFIQLCAPRLGAELAAELADRWLDIIDCFSVRDLMVMGAKTSEAIT